MPPLQKNKRKQVRFDKSLKKDISQDFKAPFCLDILAQLANIITRITLHELLRFSKKIREALRDALVDSKTFLTQVLAVFVIEGTTYLQCYLVMQEVPNITFSSEDMLTKDNRHDRPLYYIGYIGSACICLLYTSPSPRDS